jgi:hypothetical protein
VARHGEAGHGWARLGEAGGVLSGQQAPTCEPSALTQGEARLGAAWRGRAWQGEARDSWRASGTHSGSSPERPRTAWLGWARHGVAGLGIDGERTAYIEVRVLDAHARQRLARPGAAWHGEAGLGMAGHGKAREFGG